MAEMIDKELEQYQRLMPVPTEFEDGFGIKTVIGALFIGFLMVLGKIEVARVWRDVEWSFSEAIKLCVHEAMPPLW